MAAVILGILDFLEVSPASTTLASRPNLWENWKIMTDSVAQLREAIRDVPDFPKPGIIFKDITPILADPELLRLSVDCLAEAIARHTPRVDKIVGIDARGFIFGAMVAQRLGAGFVPIRKVGKLPWETLSRTYALEYGEAEIEIHRDAVQPRESVVLVDDLLATGGTAVAASGLVEQLGPRPRCAVFLIELEFLNGRQHFRNLPVESILKF